MEYTKISDFEFTATETKQDVKKYNITDLKNDKAIYLAHVVEYQAKADAMEVLIQEAEKLGIVEYVAP